MAITESVFLGSKGKVVQNIEEKKKPGGAWVTVDYDSIPKVEIGCHIWSYHKEVYDFISSFFKLEILNLPVQPKIIYKSRFIPYDLKANLITLKVLARKTSKFDFAFAKEFKENPEMRLSLIPSKYKYPKFGAKELEASVHKLVSDHQLSVRINTVIKQVELKANGGNVVLGNGEKVGFSEELVLTSLSQLDKITFEDGSVLVPKTRDVQYIHRHLIVKGAINKKFSYLRLMNHDLIHRISDMTSQVKAELDPSTFLICVGIHEKAYYDISKEEQERQILKTLISLKLFKSDAKVVISESNVFPSFYNNSDMFGDIEKRSQNKIRFLRSTDFVYSFYNQLSRYKSLLD